MAQAYGDCPVLLPALKSRTLEGDRAFRVWTPPKVGRELKAFEETYGKELE